MTVSTPASNTLSTAWELVEWAATCLPNLWASSTMAVSSITSKDGRDGNEVRVLPPDAVILMKSAPSLISCRTPALHSSGPVAVEPK